MEMKRGRRWKRRSDGAERIDSGFWGLIGGWDDEMGCDRQQGSMLGFANQRGGCKTLGTDFVPEQ